MPSFLVRVILFTIAISVIRSVVNHILRLWHGGQPRTVARSPRTHAAQGSTELRQDPVCGTYVAVDSSLKKIVRGQVIHFCSPECRSRHSA